MYITMRLHVVNPLLWFVVYVCIRDQGWWLLNWLFRVPLFSHFLESLKHWVPVWYHVHIWQVSPQLICGHTRSIWTWIKILSELKMTQFIVKHYMNCVFPTCLNQNYRISVHSLATAYMYQKLFRNDLFTYGASLYERTSYKPTIIHIYGHL